jgi:hypothetical protein
VVERFKKINLTFHFPPASKFSNVAMCIFNVNFGVGVGFYFKLRQEKKMIFFQIVSWSNYSTKFMTSFI